LLPAITTSSPTQAFFRSLESFFLASDTVYFIPPSLSFEEERLQMGERGIRSLKLAIFLTISPFMLHGTTSLYALAFSICSACLREVSVSLAPLSIRATSSVRSSPLIGRTVVRVRPPTAFFSIT
jgi:hypothetical protein